MAGVKVTLSGNFTKLDELKGKANSTAASIRKAFGSDFGRKAFAGLAAGATAAFATIVAASKSAIIAGGELSDMMAKTGASGRTLLILGQAFRNAGLAANETGNAIVRLQKALAGVNEDGERVTTRVFADLGLSIREIQSMDPGAALMKVGEAIAAIEDPAQRAALAMELFGRSGANLNVLFTDSKAFEVAEGQLGGLADLLPGMANEADFVADAFASLDVKLQQLGAGVASGLMPELLNLSQWLNETDFTETGERIGMVTAKIAGLQSAAERIAKTTLPYWIGRGVEHVMFDGGNLTEEDKERARKMAASWAANDPQNGKPRTSAPAGAEPFNPFAEGRKQLAEQQQAVVKGAERAAEIAKQKADAEAKAAREKARGLAAAVEEYNLESELLNARIAGDKERIAAAERELAIRREIAALVGQGFTAAEARRPAEAKVDAEARAAALEKQREEQAAAAESANAANLQKLQDLTAERDALRFQSTIGAISSMQRIGGGGGAISSGLDYQRQATDLTREILAVVREVSGKMQRAPVDY